MEKTEFSSILSTSAMGLMASALQEITDKIIETRTNDNHEITVFDHLFMTLSKITKAQSAELAKNIDSVAVMSAQDSGSLLRMTDLFFSRNLTEIQIENLEKMNNVLIICLELSLEPGTSGILDLQNSKIEFTSQNVEIFAQNYEFADIIFPDITSKLSNIQRVGLSRRIWKINQYSSIFDIQKLAASISSIQLNDLDNKQQIILNGLEDPIQIIFPISDAVWTTNDDYYCIYYNTTFSNFSEYELETIVLNDQKILCETRHLSRFTVAMEPMAKIVQENNAEMLYDLGALKTYHIASKPRRV